MFQRKAVEHDTIWLTAAQAPSKSTRSTKLFWDWVKAGTSALALEVTNPIEPSAKQTLQTKPNRASLTIQVADEAP